MPTELNQSSFIGSVSYKGRKVNIEVSKFSDVFSVEDISDKENKPFSRKYTPEEARAAIERVMEEAEPQKPRVKQYQTTQGMIKKQLSEQPRTRRIIPTARSSTSDRLFYC